MRRGIVAILVGIWCLLGRIQVLPTEPLQLSNRRGEVNRSDKLLRAVQRSKGTGFRRAFEELSVKGNVDAVVWNAAVMKMKEEVARLAKKEVDVYLPPLWVEGLAAREKVAIPAIIRILKSRSPSSEELRVALIVLGRMGPMANEVIPILREQLLASATPQTIKVQMRIVLANLGDNSKETLAAILSGLKEWTSQNELLRTLALIHPGNWVSDDLLKVIIDEATPEAAIALGALGKRAASAAKMLDERQLRDIRAGRPTQIVYGLALARIDQRRQETVLRRVCKYYIGRDPLGGLMALLRYPPYVLINAEISDQLSRLIHDRDPDVSWGAIELLEQSGLLARKAAPRVLEFVRGTADTERRIKAARVLAHIADYSLLPDLKAAAKMEQSLEVRRQLETTVNFIESLEPDEN